MTFAPKRDSQGSAEPRALPSATPWQREISPGPCWATFSLAPPVLRVWQRREVEIRTDASAPLKTGLPLTGMCWLDSPRRRCRHSFEVCHNNSGKPTGILAAAQEPSGISVCYSSNILSAFRWQNRRQVSPGLILGGGDPCWLNPWPPHRAAENKRTSLRSTRILPPPEGNQPSLRRTHTALPGAAGVDSKTGAAIHRPVAPEESV